MPDAVTMDKIVSLSRRRGFVFPSSEIYGGLGSTYDYGHYGVLLKNNVKARWLEAMVQERDDIVALDSAIILHPRVWEASGHVGGFTDPLVDCRTCKLRFRADQLEEHEAAAAQAEQAAGRDDRLRPDRGAAVQPDVRDARSARSRRKGSRAYLRPETAQGIFINFKNVLQIARRKPPFGIAQVGKSFRNEITPGNFLFRMREFEQMEMEFFVPPAEAEQWYRYWIDERLSWYLALRPAREQPAGARARRRGAVALLKRHERHRVPVSDRLVGARGDREPRRLRPDAAHGALDDEARVRRRRTASATCRT